MEATRTVVKEEIDLKSIYGKFKSCLKGAKKGEVVTRFPPEPSGYLHIGHVKALVLNYHYSKIYDGKMILRFDDTNPAKENMEFIQSIKDDIELLQIFPDVVTHTSDNFELISDACEKLIKAGDAFCDDTPVEEMRALRFELKPSAKRDLPIEENLRVWEEMKKGSEEGKKYVVRAKISFNNKNGCLRDPTIYRCVDMAHPITGNKYKVYPTYDFAVPIVDSLEGVTHCMRSVEFNDRKDQYDWFIKKLGYKKNKIYEYSKLAMTNTIMSKRYLRQIVADGIVEGWNDPRFPTIRGIIRRGMLVSTLIEFMMDQGPSRNNNLMEWDKIWSLNKKNLEKQVAKYCAVYQEKVSTVTVTNVTDQIICKMQPVSKKQPELGEFPLYTSNKFFINFEDAESLEVGEKFTLMNYMNANITTKTQAEDGSWNIEAEVLPGDDDFKSTKKISWVIADPSLLTRVKMIQFDHLLLKDKLEENDKLEDFLNRDSRHECLLWADGAIRDCLINQFIQFQRISNFRIDRKYYEDGQLTFDAFFIPSGKTKGRM